MRYDSNSINHEASSVCTVLLVYRFHTSPVIKRQSGPVIEIRMIISKQLLQMTSWQYIETRALLL